MLRKALAAIVILVVMFGPPLVAWRWDEIKRAVWRLQHPYIAIHRNDDRKRQ